MDMHQRLLNNIVAWNALTNAGKGVGDGDYWYGADVRRNRPAQFFLDCEAFLRERLGASFAKAMTLHGGGGVWATHCLLTSGDVIVVGLEGCEYYTNLPVDPDWKIGRVSEETPIAERTFDDDDQPKTDERTYMSNVMSAHCGTMVQDLQGRSWQFGWDYPGFACWYGDDNVTVSATYGWTNEGEIDVQVDVDGLTVGGTDLPFKPTGDHVTDWASYRDIMRASLPEMFSAAVDSSKESDHQCPDCTGSSASPTPDCETCSPPQTDDYRLAVSALESIRNAIDSELAYLKSRARDGGAS